MPALVVKALNRGDRDVHPERSVVLSRVANRIEMGAEKQRAVADAFESADQVANVVPAH